MDIITNLTCLETRLKSCGDFFDESRDKPNHALSQACATVTHLCQRLHDVAAALASCTEQFTLLCQNVVKLHDQKVVLVHLAHDFKSSRQQALIEHYCLKDQLEESLAVSIHLVKYTITETFRRNKRRLKPCLLSRWHYQHRGIPIKF